MMAAISASLSLCLVALLLGAGGPRTPFPVAMTWLAFAGGVAGVILWSVRWPSPAQSVAFALVTNTSIALACLAYPEPVSTLVGCIAFATSGAYIAFFLTSKYVVYNFAVATVVATTAAVQMASDQRRAARRHGPLPGAPVEHRAAACHSGPHPGADQRPGAGRARPVDQPVQPAVVPAGDRRACCWPRPRRTCPLLVVDLDDFEVDQR